MGAGEGVPRMPTPTCSHESEDGVGLWSRRVESVLILVVQGRPRDGVAAHERSAPLGGERQAARVRRHVHLWHDADAAVSSVRDEARDVGSRVDGGAVEPRSSLRRRGG